MKYLLYLINKGLYTEVEKYRLENLILKSRVAKEKPTQDRLRKERNELQLKVEHLEKEIKLLVEWLDKINR